MRGVFAAVCAVLLFAAAPAHAVVFRAPAGESAFKVPRGVTELTVTAVGERAGGSARQVTHSIMVGPEALLTLRVGWGGGLAGDANASRGGGLSGVYDGAAPLVVAAGGGGAGSSGLGGSADGSGSGGTASDAGGNGVSPGGGGGGAGHPGGAGGSAGAGGRGGSSYPVTGVPSTAPASLTLEYNDPVAPEVTVVHPGELNPTLLTGQAGTDTGDAGSVSVELFSGEFADGEPSSASAVGLSPDGTFSAAIGQLAEGVWTARAVQYDSAGNRGVSNAVTFYFDRSGPKVELTWPARMTNDANTSIEGALGTAPGDLEEVTVTVTGPGGYRETATAQVRGSDFTAVLDAPLADGTYEAVARQEDRFHHVGTASRTFVVDTVAPVVTLAGSEGDVTAVQLHGTASEDGTVVLDFGAGRTVDVPVVAGVFTADVALPDGAYTATARLFDAAGNPGVAVRSFRLDATAPAVDFSGVRARYTRGETVAAPFTCADPSGVAVCEGALDTSTAGEHVLTVSVRDQLGNVGSASVRYTVVVAPVATIRKSASALKIAKASRLGRTVTLRGSVARSATGTVVIRAGGVTKRVKLSRGAWSVKLKLRRAQRVRVTVSYAGDALHTAATVRRTVE